MELRIGHALSLVVITSLLFAPSFHLFFSPLFFPVKPSKTFIRAASESRLFTCVQRFEPIARDQLRAELEAQPTNFVARSGRYGRLGNRLSVALKMAVVASQCNCSLSIADDLVEQYVPPFVGFKNTQSDGTLGITCTTMTEDEWFHSEEPNNRTVDDWCNAVNVLRLYLQSNRTHALGEKCPSDPFVVFHVRSGDIASGSYENSEQFYVPSESIHNAYGPPPSAYYAKVLQQNQQTKVFVLCETEDNPTCGFFQKVASFSNVELRIKAPLLEDVRLLMCAQQVAVSVGTFRNILLLSEGQHIHQFSSEHVSQCSKAPHEYAKTMYFMKDTEQQQLYNEGVLKNWKNNAYQRHLLNLHYEMEQTECT